MTSSLSSDKNYHHKRITLFNPMTWSKSFHMVESTYHIYHDMLMSDLTNRSQPVRKQMALMVILCNLYSVRNQDKAGLIKLPLYRNYYSDISFEKNLLGLDLGDIEPVYMALLSTGLIVIDTELPGNSETEPNLCYIKATSKLIEILEGESNLKPSMISDFGASGGAVFL